MDKLKKPLKGCSNSRKNITVMEEVRSMSVWLILYSMGKTHLVYFHYLEPIMLNLIIKLMYMYVHMMCCTLMYNSSFALKKS